ncbi:hypothetical protein N7532_010538 [Penicillium argentinense]|uniref:Xylanolytic transcriptional activator regulatory domain-containing protein n=1 Tax=Penicillium argentinense TaxID=1131581 RepID=A0A9W9EPT2_9EURO|nr:uncharacterized protein N7532_010538 [Penicillium argentinense]KAJ5085767.1 hypothetical protein N7532_010538 [Penicillium argentinense]
MDQEMMGLESPPKPLTQVLDNVQLSPVDAFSPRKRQDTLNTQLKLGDVDDISAGDTIQEALRSPLQDSRINMNSSNTSTVPMQDEQQAASSQPPTEADETDLEGHYVGPSSGVSFLLRVQKRLHENLRFSASEPIFNFGDAPFPTYDPHFLVLPPLHEALTLVNRYFDFSFPTHRFLHQATVEEWVRAFYSVIHGADETVSKAIKAVILMVMAQGRQYLSATDQSTCQSVNSNVYFAASENHLSSEKGPVQLTSIQARLAQCFYLLSESRMNHCWSLFGTTARLAQAIGINRRRRRELITDHVEEECRKRTFWCAYSLDNYLSAALGRPRIFHDEDIDQELPNCANDSQILRHTILPAQSSRQSLMLAPIYHAKLSRIMSGILRDLYGIQQKPLSSQTEIARKYETDLSLWRAGIAEFIDTPNIELLQITFQRQCSVLNLAFEHAKVLLYRPFILQNLASLGKETSAPHSPLQEVIGENIKKGLEAATRTVEIFQSLCRTRRMYKSFWFTHYNVFCAIVVLYVYVIQTWSKAGHEYEHCLRIGEEAQAELAKCGTKSSFPQRYVVVLEELRREARKITAQSASQYDTSNTSPEENGMDSVQLGNAEGIQSVPSHNQDGDVVYPPDPSTWLPNIAQDTSPASYLADMTGWGDFDSIVLTGLGDLGHMFPREYSY